MHISSRFKINVTFATFLQAFLQLLQVNFFNVKQIEIFYEYLYEFIIKVLIKVIGDHHLLKSY